MIVYRTVKINKDKYESYFAKGKYCLTYEIGKATLPIGNAKPMAFLTLEFLKDFFARVVIPSEPRVILECNADITEEAKLVCWSAGEDYLDEYYANLSTGIPASKGSVWCDSITPIRIMEE